MVSTSTGDLVRGWRAARAGSFAAVHERLSPRLRAWAEIQVPREVRDVLDPEEILQETWIQAWRGFRQFDPDRGPFRSWLFGIAYNVLRSQLRDWRRRDRRRSPFVEASAAAIDEEATSVIDRVARGFDAEALHNALDQLDETDRLVVVYRGLEGLPHAEVARRIGLSLDAVETRWRRLRPRLRKLAEHLGIA